MNFRIVSGPNAGRTGQAVTDTQGNARFSYTGDAQGGDVVQASITKATGTPGRTR